MAEFMKYMTGAAGAEDQQDQLGLAAEVGQGKDPTKAARVLRMQMKTGLPPDIIEGDLDNIESQAASAGFNPDEFRKKHPATAAWAGQDPNHYALIKNETGLWGKLESIASSLKEGWEKTNTQSELAKLLTKEMDSALTPVEAARRDKLKGDILHRSRAEQNQGTAEYAATQAGYSAGQFVDSSAAAMRGMGWGGVAGAAAGSPIAGVGAAPGAAAGMVAGGLTANAMYSYDMERAFAFDELRGLKDVTGKEIDINDARAVARAVGAVNSVIEVGSDLALAWLVPGAKNVLRGLSGDAAKQAVRERVISALRQPSMAKALVSAAKGAISVGSIEGLEEFFQAMVGAGGREIAQASSGQVFAPDPLSKDVESAVQQARDAWVGTTLSLGLGIGGAKAYVGVKQVKAAQANKAFYDALASGMTESEAMKALPEKARELVKNITKDGPMEDVYVDPAVWTTYWQSKGVDPKEVAKEVVDNPAEYDASVLSGAPIRIPTDAYAAKIAVTEHSQYFGNELRSSPDAMNAREASEYKFDAEQLVKENAEQYKFLSDEISRRLVGVGFDKSAADAQSQQMAKFFMTQGDINKIDPMAMFDKWVGNFKRGDIPAGAMAQDEEPIYGPVDVNDPKFQEWQGRSQVVDPVYHWTPNDFSEFSGYGTLGHHFGTAKAAEERGKHSQAHESNYGQRQTLAGRTLPMYIKLENPIRTMDVGNWMNSVVVADSLSMNSTLPKGLRDQLRELANEMGDIQEQFDTSQSLADILADDERVADWMSPFTLSPENSDALEEIRSLLEMYGYDGIVYRNEAEDAGNDSYIVLRPEQVKSAISNTGEYGDTPNFMRQNDGQEAAGNNGYFGSARLRPEDIRVAVNGKEPRADWQEGTRIRGRSGGPLVVYRGSDTAASGKTFEFDRLGYQSGHPTSGRGVHFTTSVPVAAKYGRVRGYYLDIRNPYIVEADTEIPGSEEWGLSDWHKWREGLKAKGYDGIIITARRLGSNRADIVAFDASQVMEADPQVYFQSAKINKIGATGTAALWIDRNENKVPAQVWAQVLKAGKAERMGWDGVGETEGVHTLREWVKNDGPAGWVQGGINFYEHDNGKALLTMSLGGYLSDMVEVAAQGAVVGDMQVAQALAIFDTDPDGATKSIEKYIAGERKSILREWQTYLTVDNEVYAKDPFFVDYVWSGVTEDLREDRPDTPVGLDAAALAMVYDRIQNEPGLNSKFMRLYQAAMTEIAATKKQYSTVNTESGKEWIKIPQTKDTDPEYAANSNMIRAMSCATWCTSRGMEKVYVQRGDFWILRENGETRLAIRFDGTGDKATVAEIQGPQNNGTIPPEYSKDVSELMDSGAIRVSDVAKKRAEAAMRAAEVLQRRIARRAEASAKFAEASAAGLDALIKAFRLKKVDGGYAYKAKSGVIGADELVRFMGSDLWGDVAVLDLSALAPAYEYATNADENNPDPFDGFKLMKFDGRVHALSLPDSDKLREVISRGFVVRYVGNYPALTRVSGGAVFGTEWSASPGLVVTSDFVRVIGGAPKIPTIVGSPRSYIVVELAPGADWGPLRGVTVADRIEVHGDIPEDFSLSGLSEVREVFVRALSPVRLSGTMLPAVSTMPNGETDGYNKGFRIETAGISGRLVGDDLKVSSGFYIVRGDGDDDVDLSGVRSAYVVSSNHGATAPDMEVVSTIDLRWNKKSTRNAIPDDKPISFEFAKLKTVRGDISVGGNSVISAPALTKVGGRIIATGERLSLRTPNLKVVGSGFESWSQDEDIDQSTIFEGSTLAPVVTVGSISDVVRHVPGEGGNPLRVIVKEVHSSEIFDLMHLVRSRGADVLGVDVLRIGEDLATRAKHYMRDIISLSPKVVVVGDFTGLAPSEIDPGLVEQFKEYEVVVLADSIGQPYGQDGLRVVGFVKPGVKSSSAPFKRGYVAEELVKRFPAADYGPSVSSPMYQKDGEDKPRAYIQIGPDKKMDIGFLESADLSSFLHESGHLYLEVLRDLYTESGWEKVKQWFGGELEDGPRRQQAKQDMNKLLSWLGVSSFDEITPAHHEKFARGIEAYFMEGHAPSPELRAPFARYKAWLMAVYQFIEGYFSRIKLNPEVRDTFDRLFATEAEIAAAKAESEVVALFSSPEDVGMSEADFRRYMDVVEEASMNEREELLRKLMRQMKAERSKEWRRRRDAVRKAVAEEVDARPVYAAVKFMREGDDQRLDRQAVYAMYPGKYSENPVLQKLVKLDLYRAEGGVHPDVVAPLFGFGSGDEMVRAIVEADRREDIIDKETDSRMQATYGSENLEGSVADNAIKAVHGPMRSEVIAAEIRALKAAVKAVAPHLAAQRKDETAQRRAGMDTLRASTPDLSVVRRIAHDTLAAIPVRRINANAYLIAARNSSKAAVAAVNKKDFMSAAHHKQKELLNVELYRRAMEMKDEVSKIVDYMNGFSKSTVREKLARAGDQYLEQIDAILERFDFRRSVTGPQAKRRLSLVEWVEARVKAGLPVNVPKEVLNEAYRKPYKDMTLDEMQAISDTAKHIQHMSALKNKLMAAMRKRELNAVIDLLTETAMINARHSGKVDPETRLPQNAIGDTLGGFLAAHRKMSSIVREIDGFVDGGAWWESVMWPINQAAAEEAYMHEQANERLRAIFGRFMTMTERVKDAAMVASFGKIGEGIYARKYIKEIDASLSHMGRLMVALNWGNEDNRQRVMDGYQWTQSQVDAILDGLGEDDWRFVQVVWDFLEEYWPKIEGLSKRVDGIAPKHVQASPVTTKYGTFKGGYFPLVYDDRQAPRAYAHLAKEAAQAAMRGAAVRNSTAHGHREQRYENVKLPVRLDFSVIFEHVNRVIHDLTHYEMLVDMNRLLGNPAIQSAVVQGYGHHVYRQLQHALQDIAGGDVAAQRQLDKAIGWLRRGTTIAAMGWNLTTGLMQPLGITQSIVRVGPQWIAKGVGRWLGSAARMENTVKWVHSVSKVMQERSVTQLREINEIRNQVAPSGLVGPIQDTFFYFIVKLQMVVDIPTWLGAYEKALAADPSDEQRAIALADQAVLDSQGGGQVKDRSAFQRGSQWMQLWTNFFTYANVTGNLTAEEYRRTNFKNPYEAGRFLVNMLLLYTVPATLAVLIREAVRSDSQWDWDKIAKRMVLENLSYMAGPWLLVRETAGALQGFHGYEGPAGSRFFAGLSDLITQTAQGDADKAFWKAANDTAGTLFHYPAGQVQRTVEGVMYDLDHGSPSMAPIAGPPKHR